MGEEPSMTQEVVSLVLDEFDLAHGLLHERLAGLTDEEFFWEPVVGCWTVRRKRPDDQYVTDYGQVGINGKGEWVSDYAIPDPAPPPFTTIAWRLVHIAYDAWMWEDHVFGDGRLFWDDYEIPHDADSAVGWWEKGSKRFRARVAELQDEEPARTDPLGIRSERARLDHVADRRDPPSRRGDRLPKGSVPRPGSPCVALAMASPSGATECPLS